MEREGHPVSRARFEQYLHGKQTDPAFMGDIAPLLSTDVVYDSAEALRLIQDVLLVRLPGDPWRGTALKGGPAAGDGFASAYARPDPRFVRKPRCEHLPGARVPAVTFARKLDDLEFSRGIPHARLGPGAISIASWGIKHLLARLIPHKNDGVFEIAQRCPGRQRHGGIGALEHRAIPLGEVQSAHAAQVVHAQEVSPIRPICAPRVPLPRMNRFPPSHEQDAFDQGGQGLRPAPRGARQLQRAIHERPVRVGGLPRAPTSSSL
jgi:hypothetical protein